MTTFASTDRIQSGTIDVLHVDDEPGLADTAEAFLERHDDRFSVATATDATEGLAIIEEGGLDCVVSDYDMPGLNGIEFLEAVRERDPDLPFVLYTGKGSEEVASEAISAGVTDYLQKESGTTQYAVLANRIANAVEQYRSRHAVEETERKLSEIAEKTDDVLFMFDADWSEVLFVNSAYEEMWGGSIEELKREPGSFLELVHPEDRERAVDAMERLSAGDPVEIEYRIVTPEGETRWVRGDSKPIVEDGTVARIVGYVQDVTERKERERELRRRDRRYQAVFNDPNILVGLVDTDGTVLDINETAMEYVDATLEAVIGDPFWETPWFTHSESLIEEVQSWVDRAAKGEYVEFEAELVRPDGEPYTVQGVFRPVTTEDGEVVSLLISDRDITPQRERERELTRLKRRYQAFVENASDVITIIDESGEIQYESPAIEQFGYDQDELVGENAFEYVHPEDRDEVAETFAEILSRPETTMERVEFRFERADGSWIWLEATGSSETDEAIGGYVITSRDVTDRKERERELRRRNDRLDEFASVVSHDLRNPLNVAGGWLELARDDCDSEHLENVAKAHDRMNDLIDGLLDLAREGEEVSARESIDLATVAETCWQSVDTDDATLTVTVDRTVDADRSRFQQLLENLYRNAIEHGGRDVTVTVGDHADGFYVEDDGPGIPEDVRENVFDAGYSTTQSGTGFGLSIVYDIANSHGWTVDVTTGADGGARFEVTGLSSA